MSNAYILTSESVGPGHPDKIADQISDAVLDALLAQDKHSRVACVLDIGYDDSRLGFDGASAAVLVALDKQSPDIAIGVNEGSGLDLDQGAGDQGLMFGFACRETEELMPMPIMLAHRLTRQQNEIRRSGVLPWLRPDAKAQVSVRYVDDKPAAIDTVVVSTQHAEDVDHKTLKDAVIEEIVKPVIPAAMISNETRYLINPTGRFVVGGPHGDCGLTGRKIIVDTYGGIGRHGGGAFSGKDPSKVQVSYAIGVAEPTSVHVNTQGTARVPERRIEQLIREHFDLRPKGIVQMLDLLRPIYRQTASNGHFGRTEPELTWENTDKAADLAAALDRDAAD